ncbi:MAG: YdcF family protein [Burkholderiaceae bacterium]|jgi:uncharacterized SAM-binding protein YcdF (DUF218 family)|nr:YdcF family protein [Burkholderiaceae bacterium]
MNDIVASLGLEGLKPLADALLLPPLPLIALVLVAAWLLPRRRVLGWSLVLLACTGLWLSATEAAGRAMRASVHPVPPALAAPAVEALAREAADARRARRKPTTAIVVVGGGLRELAPEYGMTSLSSTSIERLRYGMWLARETGLPVVYSGGVGHGDRARHGPVASEAEVATRIAEREFRLPLRWAEGRSRDTVENGLLTVPMLAADGVTKVILVTHDYHQRRALRAFELGARRAGVPLEIVPAPVGLAAPGPWQAGDFLPTASGLFDTRRMLHEYVGWLAGA